MQQLLTALVLVLAVHGQAFAQQCLHGPGETAEQTARRRAALAATRTVNNIQANQPRSRERVFFTHAQLADAPFAAGLRNSQDETVRTLSLVPDTDIVSGWRLTLDVTPNGYWFMVQDTTDPCGFAFISNHVGVIFTAEPLRR